jgi:hypothetical protein
MYPESFLPRSARPLGAALAGLAILAVACQPRAGERSSPEAQTPRAAAVTLFTGDRVEIDQDARGLRRYRAIAGPGRTGIRFAQLHRRTGPLVIPSDVGASLARGEIDPRRFDVERLLRGGEEEDPRPTPRPAAGTLLAQELHEYTMTIRDRNGQLTGAIGGVLNTETFEEQADLFQDPDGLVRLLLPAGKYVVYGLIPAGEGGDWVLFGNPALVVEGPVQQTFDARTAAPVSVGVERPDARLVESQISVGYRFGPEVHELVGRIPVGVLVGGSRVGDPDLSHVFVIGSAAGNDDAFNTIVYSLWARPTGGGGGDPVASFHNSPYRYSLGQVIPREVPASPSWKVKDSELGQAKSTYAFNQDGATGLTISDIEILGGPWFNPVPPGVSSDLPFARADLFTPGVVWFHNFLQNDSGQRTLLDQAVNRRIYTAGATVDEPWNLGPFGPGFGVPLTLFDQPAYRSGDRLSVMVPMFSEGVVSHYGFATFVNGEQVLYREGTEIAFGTWPGRLRVDVPPEPATYRLKIDVSQLAEVPSSRLATRVIGSWVFGSAQVDGTAKRPLPLMAVRYSPALDDRNRAPSEGPFPIPITVERPIGETSATTSSLAIEASFDDGQTWSAVPVAGSGMHWTATVTHPPLGATSGFVSLRATATDTAGNSATQTIIRAYELTSP